MLNSFSLRYKLFILLATMLTGLLLLIAIININMNQMKERLDNIYFGNFIPVKTLQTMRMYYSEDIVIPLYKVRYGLIDSNEVKSSIVTARSEILALWKQYKKIYKSDSELPYIEYTNELLKKTEHYLEKVVKALDNDSIRNKISLSTLSKRVETIDIALEKIENYEIESARVGRKGILEIYEMTSIVLNLISLAAIILALLISLPIIRSIRNNQLKLEENKEELEQLNIQLKEAALNDSLTGLHNRRYFNDLAKNELRRCAREKRLFAFLMLDIDYFKQYNDTYGHPMGDKALQDVAKSLKDSFQRPGDYVFRLGGEEFGVILSPDTQTDAMERAKTVNERIKGLEIEHSGSKVESVLTVSIGVRVVDVDSDSNIEEIMHSADEALYRAKEDGRNRAVQA